MRQVFELVLHIEKLHGLLAHPTNHRPEDEAGFQYEHDEREQENQKLDPLQSSHLGLRLRLVLLNQSIERRHQSSGSFVHDVEQVWIVVAQLRISFGDQREDVIEACPNLFIDQEWRLEVPLAN